METVVTSPTKEVVIGAGRPFVIIGERINPTGRKLLGKEMAAGNFDRVRQDAIAQVQAGAQMLDVNAGIPMADEPAVLAEAIRIVQSVTDAPIAIDSSVVAALASGLEAYQGKALVNSVTGEEERLESVLPLVAQHGAAVIGIANDETGISHDPNVRFDVAKRIVERAESFGIPRADVIIDPLAMPVGAVHGAGATFIKLVRRIRGELGVNTTCGASNISFGLPGRPSLNAAFLAMIIGAGMTCAITNPLEAEMMKAILGADAIMGHDENCQAWIAHHKTQTASNGTGRRVRRPRTASSGQ
ncbi:dihydropteroate synthase [Candidatus Leptofilum sp.]|uniref:dihydropteroate synthase n=1 Tax=Candidatus Leptofilum sp. TaxID=3241576 RepID=UPI003B58D984